MLEVDGFYGQLLGLFELYSMGVHVPSAIESYCEQVLATGDIEQMRSLGGQLDEYVAAVEGAEGSDGSCEEEDEHEGDSDSDSDGEGEGENADEEGIDALAQDETDGEHTEAPCAKRRRTVQMNPGAIEDTAADNDTHRQMDTERHRITEREGPEEMFATAGLSLVEQCKRFIADAAAGDLVEFPPLDATVSTSLTTCSAV